MFWKMSSALKDCQQDFEAGTLESDRKRAFGLFFSPRNPAPLASPWQLRFYFFTSPWERRNKTRPGRGLLMLALAWAHGQLPGQGVSRAASDHPASSAAPGSWWDTCPSSPKQQGSLSWRDLQSPWSVLQHMRPFHVAPGGRAYL